MKNKQNVIDEEKGEELLEKAIDLIKKEDYVNALKYLKSAYECGNTQAHLLLADAYKNGLGTKQDLAKVRTLYEELANKDGLDENIAMAQFNLSVMYAKGIGVKPDLKKSLEWIKKSADNGFTTAQHTYGYFLEKGQNGAKVNLKEAEKYYIRAAVKEHVDAQCNLVMLYVNNDEFDDDKYINKIIYWLQKATENGHHQTASILEQYKQEFGKDFPSMSECAEAVQEDYDWVLKEEKDKLRKHLNLTEEQFESLLADTKDEDDDEEVDEQRELDQKEVDEINRLVAKGFELMQKDGDYEGAFKQWSKAYEMGSITAAYNLAQCFDMGQGVEHNASKGFELFLECATSKNVDKDILAGAQYRVGNGYFNGNGVEKDYDKAFEWYTKAADNGNMYAQYNLALCYFTGRHVAMDFNKAFHYATLAVDNDFLQAYYILGSLYLAGNGVEQNINMAKKYFTIAAERGDKNAETLLKDIMSREASNSDTKTKNTTAKSSKKQSKSALSPELEAYKNKSAQELITQDNPKKDTIQPKNYAEANSFDDMEFNKILDYAMRGDSNAQLAIGMEYLKGEDVEKDHDKAFAFFKISANRNNADATFNLALCYDNGVGVARDGVYAMKLYDKACRMGSSDACVYRYETIKTDKHSTKKDIQLAIEYLTIAADKCKTPEACGILADHYLKGELGLKKDEKKAIKYYARMGELTNDVNNILNSANQIQSCGGVENKKLALQIVDKACKMNEPSAYFLAALIYIQGEDEVTNYAKAYEYAVKAQKLGLKEQKCDELIEVLLKNKCPACNKQFTLYTKRGVFGTKMVCSNCGKSFK